MKLIMENWRKALTEIELNDDEEYNTDLRSVKTAIEAAREALQDIAWAMEEGITIDQSKGVIFDQVLAEIAAETDVLQYFESLIH